MLDDLQPRGIVDRLIKYEVISADGESIGIIGEIYNDRLTEVPTWFRVDSGFFGGKKLIIPVAGIDVADERVLTPYSSAIIKEQPEVKIEAGIDPEDEGLLTAHFGLGAAEGQP